MINHDKPDKQEQMQGHLKNMDVLRHTQTTTKWSQDNMSHKIWWTSEDVMDIRVMDIRVMFGDVQLSNYPIAVVREFAYTLVLLKYGSARGQDVPSDRDFFGNKCPVFGHAPGSNNWLP